MTTPKAASSQTEHPSGPVPARRCARAWAVFAGVFALGVGADLLSKSMAFDWVLREAPSTASKTIIPGVLRLTLSTNPGVVFGMDWIPDLAVVAVTAAALGIVVYFFAASDRRARAGHVALSMILAGAVGNLYDRLFTHVQLPGRPGPSIREVRDFVDFSPLHLGPLNYPWVFNVADVLLVIGVGILLILSFAQWRREHKAAKAARTAKQG